MKSIPLEAAVRFISRGGFYFPSSVDWYCPICGKHANLETIESTEHSQTKNVICQLRCSRCGDGSCLIAVNEIVDGVWGCVETLVHPDPPSAKISVINSAEVDIRLRRAYAEAVASYNAQIWSATVGGCRRTLEGVVKLMLPETERTGMLGAQLRKLPQFAELDEPILELAKIVKDGGNLGAHFDLEIDPEKEDAEAILELTEYLLEYLFILPSRIKQLEHRISRSSGPQEQEPSSASN